MKAPTMRALISRVEAECAPRAIEAFSSKHRREVTANCFPSYGDSEVM